MRAPLIVAASAAALVTAASAAAEPATASGAVGAGVIDGRAASVVDVGFDVSGIDYAVGFGARVRWVGGEGLRGQDWDEPSELAGLLRYLIHRRDLGPVRLSVAAGELGGVVSGQGALFAGYAAGIDLDHGHLGLQGRAEAGDYGAELIVDDVVAPRIAGARGYRRGPGALTVGLSAAADLSAPYAGGTAVVPMAAADAAIEGSAASERVVGRAYAEATGLFGLGAGLHLGAALSVRPIGADARFALRGELRAGTDHYVPGWFGPLYERDRRQMSAGERMGTQLDVARAGGLAGAGGLAELTIEIDGAGRMELCYAQRPGLSRLVVGRIEAPHRAGAQLGAWAAAAVDDGALEAAALAAEARVSLPRGIFGRLEAARLYRDRDTGTAPVWVLTAAVGAVLGE